MTSGEREELKRELRGEIINELGVKKEADTFLARRRAAAKEEFFKALRPQFWEKNQGDYSIHKIWVNVQGIANKVFFKPGWWLQSDEDTERYVNLVKDIAEAIVKNTKSA